jgi:hypothetical protein
MFNQLSKFVLFALLLSIHNLAIGQVEITSSDTIHTDYETGMKSVFHIYLPEDGVATLSVKGKDKFKNVVTGHKSNRPALMSGNSAFITFHSRGEYSIGAVTECGTSFTVMAHVYSKNNTDIDLFKKSLPKIVIDAPNSCYNN